MQYSFFSLALLPLYIYYFTQNGYNVNRGKTWNIESEQTMYVPCFEGKKYFS